MTKAEVENLIARATPFLGDSMPIREYDNELKKNILVKYKLIEVGRGFGLGESGKNSFKVLGKLKPSKGKAIQLSLKTIVDYFESPRR